MKKIIASLMCFIAINTYAQDTIKKSNSVGKFDEQFMVLKSDKKLLQGSYKVFTDKKLVASGAYDKGKRIGIWNFYNGDELEQQYDYTLNKLISDVPTKAISCEVESANPGDAVKPAVKIGGYNGLRFLVSSTTFEANLTTGSRNKVTHLISLDEKGKVTSWVATVKSDDGLKVVNQSVAEAPEDVALFLPATLNGKPVASTLTFNAEMNGTKGLADTNDQGKPNMRGGGGGRRGGRP